MRREILEFTVAVAFAISCTDSADPNSALVKGVVRLQDTWGNDLPNHSGANIGIVGMNRSTASASNGRWEIPTTPFGTLSFSFAKPGFGSYLVSDLPVDGDLELADTTYLGQTPASQLIIDDVKVSTEFGDSAFVYSAHLSSSPPANAKYTTALIFVGTSNSVSPAIATHKVWHAAIGTGAISQMTFVGFIEGYRASFQRGQTLYARGYAYSAACDCYDDPATGMRVFTNAGPAANIVSFEMR